MIQCQWKWKPGKTKQTKINGTIEKNTIQNLKHMQHQLDLFEQPIQEDQTKFFVTWEEKKINSSTLHWMAASKIKTTCRPMPQHEMLEFIEFLKSCYSYCGWYHITKA